MDATEDPVSAILHFFHISGIVMYCEIILFVGMKFRSLTTFGMFVDT